MVMQDLAQAEYDEKEILDLSTNWAVLCANCLQWGHPKITCPARVICINCSTPGHNAIDCPLHTNTNPKISCVVKSGSNIGNPINSAGFIASADRSITQRKKKILCDHQMLCMRILWTRGTILVRGEEGKMLAMYSIPKRPKISLHNTHSASVSSFAPPLPAIPDPTLTSHSDHNNGELPPEPRALHPAGIFC